jgi:hypothetical protein
MVATLFLFIAICIWCWIRSWAFLFPTTVRVAEMVQEERTCGTHFLIVIYPYTAPAASSSTAKDDAKAASGTYNLSRRSENSFLKAASLLGQFSVSPVGDGDIVVAQLTGPNGKPKHWQAVAP